MIKFFRILSKADLVREKRKDFRNVVITQIVIVVAGMVLSPGLATEGLTSKLIITVFSMFGVIYSFLLWDLLRDFTNNQFLIKGIFFVLLAIVISGLLVEFPFYRFISINDRRIFLLAIHCTMFPIEIIIIAFTIRDLFSGDFLSIDKIWGAACAYLMIGITFGSLYDILNIYSPGIFGVDIALGLPSYSEAIYFSFSTLTGIDNIYSSAGKLMINIGVIEAIWGNLFAVLIVGRLMTLPRVDPKV